MEKKKQDKILEVKKLILQKGFDVKGWLVDSGNGRRPTTCFVGLTRELYKAADAR